MSSSFMKGLPAVAVILSGAVSSATGQEIDWSMTRISATAHWILPQREFGTYWNDGPGVGVAAEVPVEVPVSIAAMAILSRHSVADTPRKAEIPTIFLVQVGGGLTLTSRLWSGFEAACSAMLVNNTFVLTGPAVRPGFENAVESEFGFSFSASGTLMSQSFPPLSVTASYQPIFVGLEPVAIFCAGIGIRLR